MTTEMLSFQQARQWWMEGQVDRATEMAQRILAVQPDHAQALNLVGCAAWAKGQTTQALALLQRAGQLAPRDAEIQTNLVQGEFGAGRIEPALRRADYLSLVQPALAALPTRLREQLQGQARPPAIAGAFYDAAPDRLRAAVDALLQHAAREPMGVDRPLALVVPHAGHMYSGRPAARAYVRMAAWARDIRRVVILGPAHRVGFRGVALPGSGSFATPLGRVPVDTLAADALADLPFVVTRPDAHAAEHALEVHLPFLQRLLGPFEVLPLVVGQVAAGEVEQVIARLWGDPHTLIVISTDLSHFHTHDEAEPIDQATCGHIRNLEPVLDHQQACGASPLNAMLAFARARGLRIEQIDRCNSGDVSGDRSRVVGYASFALYAPAGVSSSPAGLSVEEGAQLLQLARASLHQSVGAAGPAPLPAAAWAPALRQPGASFVTLTRDGQLRGCIGSLQAHRLLGEDVTANARAAALHDTRFAPVAAHEVHGLRVEVSVLSAPEPMQFANESHAVWQLRPGVDGLILEYEQQGHHWRGTYLPQVWEQIASPRAFLCHLKTKAGLPHDFWAPGVRLSRYTAQKFVE